MRELTDAEILQVNGGAFPLIGVPIVIGALTGGASKAVSSDGNPGEIIFGAAMGAAAGFFGTVAAATTGAVRALYGTYSVAAGVVTTWSDS